MVAGSLTVVQMLPGLDSGGVERGTLEMAAFLVKNGHRSIVISDGGCLVPQLKREGSIHIPWKVGKKNPISLRYLFSLRRLLLYENVDILHLRSRVPAWIGYLAWKGIPRAKRPHLITTVHGFYSVNPFSAIMTKGERVIAVSQSIKEYIIRHYPETPHGRIHVIYRGIDPDEFPFGYAPSGEWGKAWYEQYPELKGKFVLAIIGRISRLKGHFFFFDLIKDLLDKDLPVHGLVVGGINRENSRYLKELRCNIEQNKLENYITFTDYQSQVRDIMASVDVIVSFSQKPESFGRSTLEALSLGVPVAGFQNGGVKEILKSIFPSGLVRVNDIGNASDVIRRIYEQRPVPLKNHSFTLQRMLDQTLRQYYELVESAD